MNSRQRLFCEAYITSGNAYQSAVKAGYSPKTAHSGMRRLLEKPEVAAYVERRQRELCEKVVDTKRVMEELAAIAFFDVEEVAEVRDGRLVLKDTAPLGKKGRAPIAMIKEGSKGVEIKAYDKMKALELLGRAGGLFAGKAAERGGQAGEGEETFRVVVEVVDP